MVVIMASAMVGLFLYRGKTGSPEKLSTIPTSITFSHLKAPLFLTLALVSGMAMLYLGNRQLFNISLVIKKSFLCLGQRTPGPIVITATFVGYLMASIPGALVGTVSVFTPSLIMLTLAVPYVDRIQSHSLFKRGMHGILVSFVGLLLSVTIRFILTVHWGVPEGLLVVLAFVALQLKVDILWVVIAGATLST
ncbi:chromate transporter, partial [bacterium]|nr:chromate transporter [bacterium]